jgi:hypothetical protein
MGRGELEAAGTSQLFFDTHTTPRKILFLHIKPTRRLMHGQHSSSLPFASITKFKILREWDEGELEAAGTSQLQSGERK